ncbi:MAG: LapA family protein [Sulfuriferula sp.]|nr:LapA family protein [Sulfuriferula sp.]
MANKISITYYLTAVLKLALFLFILGFAVKNSDLVIVHYYLGYAWHTPLIVVILVFFVLGSAVGVTACLGYLFRQRRELASLRLAVAKLQAIEDGKHGI